MRIDGSNSVNGGNDNVKWSKELAAKLDAADGKEDGKINASVWNKFLKNNKSNGNTIKYSINLNRAEISFDYSLKTKDHNVKGLDWNNWKDMFIVFLENDKNLSEEKKAALKFNLDATEEVEEPQQPAPKAEETPTPQEADADESGCDMTDVTASFSGTLQESVLKDMNKLDIDTISKLEGFQEETELPENAPEGAKLFKNNNGDIIAISPNPEDSNTGILVYQKVNLTHKIVFDKNTKEFISGEITATQADGTEKTYSYNYKNETIDNDSIQVTPDVESEHATEQELEGVLNQLNLGQNTLPTEGDLIDAEFTKKSDTEFENNNEKIVINPKNKTVTYTRDNITIIREYNDDNSIKNSKIAIKGENGAFATGISQKDENGEFVFTPKKSHPAPENELVSLAEAVKAYEQEINTFRNSIEFNSDIRLKISDLTTEENSKEITSEDGNYKIRIDIDKSGKTTITYLKKQSENEFKKLGTITLEKFEDQNSLRGYNYRSKWERNIANTEWYKEKIDWNDFE